METLSFTVRIAKSDLADLSLDLTGIALGEDASKEQYAGALKAAINAGFDEYLGESANIEVVPS